jgi:arylformamidase
MNYFENKKIFDVSIPIAAGMAVYPDNPEVEMKNQPTQTTKLTRMTLGTHTGTHIDAPAHVCAEGATIDQLSCEHFLGPAHVIDCSYCEYEITQADIEAQIEVHAGMRLLLKTKNSERGFDIFYDDYVYLSGAAAAWLADQNISLVGIDSWSIKQRGHFDTRAHDAFLDREIPIIEGLDLKNVPAGEYDIIALPLRIKGGDAGLARVLLIEK